MDDYRCWNKHGEEGVNERDGEEGLHETCASGNEEAPFGNEELCDDDVAEIAASPVPMVENLEEMVHDAFGFDEYTGSEFKKLKQLLEDMKTPLYPSCKGFTKASPTEGGTFRKGFWLMGEVHVIKDVNCRMICKLY
ncbi:unnamed protein product [Miscanthus lutarioriparius]|uniref:Uncharacterized protein n=1 Tax=Miscanthus lutarioriparius TaxID=422564 RepID=A0A811RK98_9POAL|nr:unnamed protein product [Miscanthus lutarioriparius]